MVRGYRDSISKEALSYMGIPSYYMGKTLKDYAFANKQFKDIIYGYVTHPQEMLDDNVSLLFLGSNGAGKSFLSSIMLQHLYAQYYSCALTNFSDYISKVYNKEDVSNYLDSEWVVIDEVGAENDTVKGAEKGVLEQLLKYRDSKGKPTIICTNLTLDELSKRYGNTVYSMLGQFIPVTMTTPDRRKEVFRGKEAIKILMGGK